jgi:phage-related protein
MRNERKIIFYKNHFIDFYLRQGSKIQEKIDFVLKIIQTVETIPSKFFKFIENSDGLYEIRVEFESNIIRIFCCFEKGNIVVLFNAFFKKTQKTLKKEITLAQKLKNQYFNEGVNK